MLIKNRIIKVLEYKSIRKEEFYKKIGMSSANFRGKAKETPINSNAIENILSEIKDLNPDWLLTGTGSMLRETKEQKDICPEGNTVETQLLQQENAFLKDNLQLLKENKMLLEKDNNRLNKENKELKQKNEQLEKENKTGRRFGLCLLEHQHIN